MSRQIPIAIAGLLLGAGCATLPGGSKGDGAGTGVRRDSILVHALNENFYDARIHAVYEGGQPSSCACR